MRHTSGCRSSEIKIELIRCNRLGSSVCTLHVREFQIKSYVHFPNLTETLMLNATADIQYRYKNFNLTIQDRP